MINIQLELINQRLSNIENNLYFLRDMFYSVDGNGNGLSTNPRRDFRTHNNIFERKSEDKNVANPLLTPNFTPGKQIDFNNKKSQQTGEMRTPSNNLHGSNKRIVSPRSFNSFQEVNKKSSEKVVDSFLEASNSVTKNDELDQKEESHFSESIMKLDKGLSNRDLMISQGQTVSDIIVSTENINISST